MKMRAPFFAILLIVWAAKAPAETKMYIHSICITSDENDENSSEGNIVEVDFTSPIILNQEFASENFQFKYTRNQIFTGLLELVIKATGGISSEDRRKIRFHREKIESDIGSKLIPEMLIEVEVFNRNIMNLSIRRCQQNLAD